MLIPNVSIHSGLNPPPQARVPAVGFKLRLPMKMWSTGPMSSSWAPPYNSSNPTFLRQSGDKNQGWKSTMAGALKSLKKKHVLSKMMLRVGKCSSTRLVDWNPCCPSRWFHSNMSAIQPKIVYAKIVCNKRVLVIGLKSGVVRGWMFLATFWTKLFAMLWAPDLRRTCHWTIAAKNCKCGLGYAVTVQQCNQFRRLLRPFGPA